MRPTKVQKTKTESNQQPKKHKKKITSQTSSQTSLVEELFCYDWFLIELGSKLINRDDDDLLNILVLNKKINQRATIVFRKHFLNIQLQKEIIQLAKEKQFEKIQQHFTLSYLSLNPNESVTFRNTLPRCIAHEKKIQAEFKIQCFCAGKNRKTTLLELAILYNLIPLVKLIVSHPRLELHTNEHLLNWIAFHGHLDVLTLLLQRISLPNFEKEDKEEEEDLDALDNESDDENDDFNDDDEFKRERGMYFPEKSKNSTPKNQNQQQLLLKNSNHDLFFPEYFHWKTPIGIAVVCKHVEVLKLLLKYGAFDRFNFFGFPMLHLISKYGGGVEYFELFLNSSFILETQKLMSSSLIEAICKLNSEYAQTFITFLFDRYPFHISWLIWNHENDLHTISSLLQSCDNKKMAKTALKFSFVCGFYQHFKAILTLWDWEDEDLVELLKLLNLDCELFEHETTTQHFEILKLILKQLNSNIQIPALEIERLLDAYSESGDALAFKLLWNDKRIVERPLNFANRFFETIPDVEDENSEIFTFLFPQCLLSDLTKREMYQIEVEMEFRNFLWLNTFDDYQTISDQTFERIQQQLELKWNETLLVQSLSCSKNSGRIEFLWKNKKYIDRACWTERARHKFLLKCCEFANVTLFDDLLKEFPEIDLSKNQNQALRTFLHQVSSMKFAPSVNEDQSKIFQRFESKIQFENDSERQKICNFALKKFPDFQHRISKMRLKGDPEPIQFNSFLSSCNMM